MAVLASTCAMLTACGTDAHKTADPQRSDSATSTPAQLGSTASVAQAAPQTIVPIGDVPGNPDAVRAIQPWARDLVADDLDRLIRNCWTIDPARAREMYSDKAGILAALAQTGRDGQFTVSWSGPTEAVHLYRDEIASGYACPRVAPTGSDTTLDEADARYALHRYLARRTGSPVHPQDTEHKYRLLCLGSPLADNPGKLNGITVFDERKSALEPTDSYGYKIQVPVSSTRAQSVTFTLSIGSTGYCVNDAN
ncbi:hypothetical protein ACIA8C_06100 [Nocardia sp. NPDC051321]|uniref:hypothetical protein n=1 Tax=Nocardia sp. NPDC051321 TaxID=3364323 RepID=UPI00378B75E6